MVVPRDDTGFKIFRYDPSTAAAVIFTLLFASTTFLHFYQIVRTRTWYFIVFFIGGLCETLGYIGRIVSSTQTPNWTLGPYIINSVLTLVAPTLFAASIYMELGRIVELVDGDVYLFVKRRWLTATFVSGDILSFFMQGAGGGLMASQNQSSRDTGSNVIVGGLFIQIIFFSVFVLAAWLFHSRMNRGPTNRSLSVPWKKHMRALYIVSALILVRSIFRVVEFIQGFDGYLIRHEVYIYIFDAALMFIAMVYMNWVHPSEIQMLMRGGKSVKWFKLQEIRA
ncbi:uncharacterized protein PV09_05455 [Verruconis gallopava]|uniref:RTA1 like protein n=1 Tax=Verruconis gallopava TaxID=253628 RepID=A0A0D2A8Z1_9PEZI|nr:uncharacterized protein PV09_05455 [Verruconis gallopava]KIW03233.1 hypothetical protein PV09_05455 [Verruconis gallopava]